MAGGQTGVTLPLGAARTRGGLRPSWLPGHRCRREAYVTDIYQNVFAEGSIPVGHAAANVQGQFERTAAQARGEEVGLDAMLVATQPRREHCAPSAAPSAWPCSAPSSPTS